VVICRCRSARLLKPEKYGYFKAYCYRFGVISLCRCRSARLLKPEKYGYFKAYCHRFGVISLKVFVVKSIILQLRVAGPRTS
jgi:hypothetical protein